MDTAKPSYELLKTPLFQVENPFTGQGPKAKQGATTSLLQGLNFPAAQAQSTSWLGSLYPAKI